MQSTDKTKRQTCFKCHWPVVVYRMKLNLKDEIQSEVETAVLQFRTSTLLDDRVHECPDSASNPYSHVVAVFQIYRGFPDKTYTFRRACHDN
jgi:hypothetical protein